MATWATASTPNTGGETINAILGLGAGRFVAVGTTGTALYSSNSGVTWAAATGQPSSAWAALAFDETTLVAVASSGTTRTMFSTDFGHTWTGVAASEARQWTGETYASFLSFFVAVALDGLILPDHQVMTSATSGASWVNQTATPRQSWTAVANNGSNLLFGYSGGDTKGMTSANGTSWAATAADPAAFTQIQGDSSNIVYSSAASKFAMAGRDSGTNKAKVAYTTAGASYSYSAGAPLTGYFTFLAFAAADSVNGFVGSLPFDSALSPTPTIIGYSLDLGVTWTAENTTHSGTWSVCGWDNDTSTAVFWDADMTNTMLVGSFAGLTSISPIYGPKMGGTPCTINGIGMGGVTQGDVLFGTAEAANVTVASNGLSLTCQSPPHAVGAVTVTVTGVGTLVSAFTYIGVTSISPASGTTLGGTAVTITGSGFTLYATGVTFDGTAATSVVVVNNTTITAVTPAHITARVNVDVLGVGRLSRAYTYGTPPEPLPNLPVQSPVLQGSS